MNPAQIANLITENIDINNGLDNTIPKLTYSLKNCWNSILFYDETNELKIKIPPRGMCSDNMGYGYMINNEKVAILDGYIETPLGNFAFEDDVDVGIKLVSNIAQYIDYNTQLEKINAEIEQKNSMKRNAGPTGADDFDLWANLGGEIDKLGIQARILIVKIKPLLEKITPYKI